VSAALHITPSLLSARTFPCYLKIPRASRSTLFPYTTLFRSGAGRGGGAMSDVWGIVWLVVLLGANAFFVGAEFAVISARRRRRSDRKSTRLNSSHVKISYAVFCLKKKKTIFTT